MEEEIKKQAGWKPQPFSNGKDDQRALRFNSNLLNAV